MGIFKRRATFANARKNLQLATEAREMWDGQLQAQQAMQQEYERKLHDHTGPDFEPIGGVSVQLYGQICREIEASGGGAAKMDELAQRHGIAPGTWEQVFNEWNARSLKNVAVAQAINDAYHGR